MEIISKNLKTTMTNTLNNAKKEFKSINEYLEKKLTDLHKPDTQIGDKITSINIKLVKTENELTDLH